MVNHDEILRPLLAAQAESLQRVADADASVVAAQDYLYRLEAEVAQVEVDAGSAVFAGASVDRAAAHLATARAAVDVGKQALLAAQRNAKAAQSAHMLNQAAIYRKRAELVQSVVEQQYAEAKRFVEDLIERDGVTYIIVRHSQSPDVPGWMATAEYMERNAARQTPKE